MPAVYRAGKQNANSGAKDSNLLPAPDVCFSTHDAIRIISGMKRMTQAVLYILMLVALIAARGSVVASDTSGGEPIVHQNDLDGWQVEGTAWFDDKTGRHPVWTVANGEVFCAGHGFGFLRYDKQLADFVVSLEFKAGPNTNSGIGLRGIKYLDGKIEYTPVYGRF